MRPGRLFSTFVPAMLVVDAQMQDAGAELAAGTGVRLAVRGGRLDRRRPGGGIRYLAEQITQAVEAPRDEDIHALFLTSGSTGNPKGVMVSHRASWNRSFNGMTRTPVCGGSEINTFPLFHWAGWNYLLVPWAHLRTCHLTDRADGASVNELIERWSPRAMYAVPAVWDRILDEQTTPADGGLRHACTGTYRYDPLLIERIQIALP